MISFINAPPFSFVCYTHHITDGMILQEKDTLSGFPMLQTAAWRSTVLPCQGGSLPQFFLFQAVLPFCGLLPHSFHWRSRTSVLLSPQVLWLSEGLPRLSQL